MITKIIDRDTEEIYGYVEFHNTTYREFQNEVWHIVCDLAHKKQEWDIQDVLENLPEEWECNFQIRPRNITVVMKCD